MKISEAPERIWAYTDQEYDANVWYNHNDPRYTPKESVEYIRTDKTMQWNDNMDEAPRDGTEVLAWCGILGHRVMMWHDGWEDWSDSDGYIIGYPTHWMPLPEPPK